MSSLRRIVYLGGLAPDVPERDMSPHMRSRVRVGQILRESGIPTVEFRAAVIIGSGSASFEMLRYLTERLPAMITPRWVRTKTQPIAVRDVLRYLVMAADLPPSVNREFDIGGPEVLTYEQMMHRYAAVAGLRKRIILPINMLSPQLSSHWVGLVTPVPRSIVRPGSLTQAPGHLPQPRHRGVHSRSARRSGQLRSRRRLASLASAKPTWPPGGRGLNALALQASRSR